MNSTSQFDCIYRGTFQPCGPTKNINIPTFIYQSLKLSQMATNSNPTPNEQKNQTPKEPSRISLLAELIEDIVRFVKPRPRRDPTTGEVSLDYQMLLTSRRVYALANEQFQLRKDFAAPFLEDCNIANECHQNAKRRLARSQAKIDEIQRIFDEHGQGMDQKRYNELMGEMNLAISENEGAEEIVYGSRKAMERYLAKALGLSSVKELGKFE